MKDRKEHYVNEIYIKRSRYLKPKENFQKLINILKKDKPKKKFTLLDIGCANGELLFYIKKNFKESILTGIDVDKSLLKKAKKYCPDDIKFKEGDISSKNFKVGKFDYVICCVVLSIFTNGDLVLKNLNKQTKKKGKIFIFDSLNKYSYNLHIKANNLKNAKKDVLYKNVYSLKFIEKFFKKINKKVKIFPFFLKTNLKINKNNFIYNWTEILSKKKIVTSGLGLIQYQFWLKIF